MGDVRSKMGWQAEPAMRRRQRVALHYLGRGEAMLPRTRQLLGSAQQNTGGAEAALSS